jgi:RimJ/RimL family protein N-acetyltransferase
MLRRPLLADAPILFPLIHRTSVVRNLIWDGPASEGEFTANWAEKVARAERSEGHFFVITEPEGAAPVGACDVRPDERLFRGSIGLWIGEPYQGRGLGTRAIGALVRYAFEELRLHRLDADVFVGNWPSRAAFEKNGFVLEGTLRGCTLKLGVPKDDWCLGLLNPASPFEPKPAG